MVRYAKSISISVSLQDDMGYSGGLIYPPYVRVNYSTANLGQYKANDKVEVRLLLTFENFVAYV